MNTIGKNKRNTVEVIDTFHNVLLSADSQEERDFINFCCEAAELSIINDFEYQPCTFQLADPVKYIDINGKERSLFQKHVYSPDFLIVFDKSNKILEKEFKTQYSDLSCQHISAYIDVKGTFQRNYRSFTTDRKWVWQKFRIFINEVIPVKFFQIAGVPQKSRLTEKTRKPRKMFLGFKSISEAFGLK